MEIECIDGWYQIKHIPPVNGNSSHWAVAPRLEWCRSTFDADTWKVYGVTFTYKDVADMSNVEVTPLTWMFRDEHDAMWFMLKWQ